MNPNTSQVEALFGAKIKFVPEISNDAYSIYAVSTLSGTVLFDAVVSNLTGAIAASFPDMTEVPIDATVKMKAVGALETSSRPSSDSVKSIVYPRIISLLAAKMSA